MPRRSSYVNSQEFVCEQRVQSPYNNIAIFKQYFCNIRSRDLLKVQRSCSLERCRLVRHRARAQPAARNYHLPSPELQVVVSKVRLGTAQASLMKNRARSVD